LIYVFSVSSGTLTPVGSPFHVANGVSTVAVDPAGKFLFAPDPSTNTISVFAIQSGGTLSPGPGAFATGTAPVAAATDSTGGFLYVANSGSGNVSQFSINSSTGALTALATPTISAGTSPAFVVIDPDGKFVFVANEGSNSVTEFLINADGTLTVTSNTIQVGGPPRSLWLTR
jgi:YVTN family beta-propeller protein